MDARPHSIGESGSGQGHGSRRLLVLDGSYSIETIQKLGLHQAVLSRDLDGFFNHVWSVHPFGDLDAGAVATGASEQIDIAPRHTFIQARPGRYAALRRFSGLNFAIGQLALIAQLIALIKRERITIVRAGDPLYVGMLGWLLARLTGARFMIRVNGNNDKVRATTGSPIYPRLLRSAAVEKKIEHFVLRRADFVVGPNDDNIDFAVASGADPDRVAIIPYGNLLAPAHLELPQDRTIDADLFAALGIERGRFLLCVSRLQPLKFPDDVVRVLAKVRAAGHDVSLVLAGDGVMRRQLEALACELGVQEAVKFAGSLPQTALAQLYPQAAVVLSPLTGRALSEAALGGAAIVAYDLDWQKDVIETGVTGELVPFRNVDALASSTCKLLEQPDYRQAMSEGVRAHALQMLEPKQLDEAERQAFSQMLADS